MQIEFRVGEERSAFDSAELAVVELVEQLEQTRTDCHWRSQDDALRHSVDLQFENKDHLLNIYRCCHESSTLKEKIILFFVSFKLFIKEMNEILKY